MNTLLAGYSSDNILVSKPISLTEASEDQTEEVKELLSHSEGKTVFLPILHDGHWVYLLKEKGAWSLHDSQPLKDDTTYSPRQASMLEQSKNFLIGMEEEHSVLRFETSGKQLNDYDCGTQVINAYRKKADNCYVEKSHREILIEIFGKQCPEESLPASIQTIPKPESSLEEVTVTGGGNTNPPASEITAENNSLVHADMEIKDTLTEKEIQIIKTTSSAQISPEKRALYKENITALVSAVRKQGLFTDIQNKIAIEHIDVAKAEEHESDSQFANRLQEAEFRKAGLIK
ncbi:MULTISPECIES: hypothetical protein [unclassified Legionella]|uniref:hypothetical protein n=1 Tax=unclassified Legionella TaxID=2622702 RepID=UPI0010567685|nr:MULTISPECIES: hypothetical protein [unclassified Legionella]MDI9818395.1 hypothetical protein [Legionella sp. PL877]